MDNVYVTISVRYGAITRLHNPRFVCVCIEFRCVGTIELGSYMHKYWHVVVGSVVLRWIALDARS
jgi:hypothetical protein